jgi:S-methylmethionine-dependent homocysteine/selenocysteine methylase
MTAYRNKLPQLDSGLYLTDGGIETTLIFHEGLDLPHFAAFDLLKTPEGEAALWKYFRAYAELARRFSTGLILESATWRANPDWGERLGYSSRELDEANRRAIEILEALRQEYGSRQAPVVISGCLGPRGDGYVPDQEMSAQAAQAYHREQIRTFASSSVDMVTALTMNYTEEAVGIARAAQNSQLPVVLSFTVETDGNLPTGQSLTSAIAQVDRETSAYPAYYMINCAHPTHFEHALAEGGSWLERIRGVRANASRRSHAELNEAPGLDAGDPDELGSQYARLKQRLPLLNILGGCCGTDERHLEQIARACLPFFPVNTGATALSYE